MLFFICLFWFFYFFARHSKPRRAPQVACALPFEEACPRREGTKRESRVLRRNQEFIVLFLSSIIIFFLHNTQSLLVGGGFQMSSFRVATFDVFSIAYLDLCIEASYRLQGFRSNLIHLEGSLHVFQPFSKLRKTFLVVLPFPTNKQKEKKKESIIWKVIQSRTVVLNLAVKKKEVHNILMSA